MLIRDVVRITVFSLLLFLQCVSSGFAAQTTGAESTPTQESSGGQATPTQESSGGQASSVLPEVKTYEELRHAISEARAASRVRVEKAVEQERVREAWEIGRLIDVHVLQHKERADYAEYVLPKLAQDLGMDRSELYRMLKFYRIYPIVVPAQQLTWSHYEALLAVNDPKEREALAERTEKENWTRDRLREEVKAFTSKSSAGESASEKLAPSTPGTPGTHKIILAKTGPYAGELAIDLGFSNYVRLSEVVEDVSPFKEGEVIALSDEEGEIHVLSESSATEASAGRRGAGDVAQLFTYRAWVYRVLDGDTIEAVVDLGFGITTTQTLRLRGIDAPEIVTADGVEAKEFVEKALQIPGNGKRGTQTSILIKTVKSDKYDRYLADVFVGDVYINQQLLDEGLAVRVED